MYSHCVVRRLHLHIYEINEEEFLKKKINETLLPSPGKAQIQRAWSQCSDHYFPINLTNFSVKKW
jgi:hypothetical protein